MTTDRPSALWVSLIALSLLAAGTADAGKRRPRGNSVDDAFEQLESRFNLYFLDAVTGKPVPGATVSFEGSSQSTDDGGSVNFAMPTDLGAEDRRAGEFRCDGYVSTRFEVEFLSGLLFFNRYSVSPSLPAGPLRVVLDWSEKPGDLDAHLKKEGAYHISYREKIKVEDQAALDRDDTDGQGPETITVQHPDDGATYSFFVHDYSNRSSTSSKALAASRAHVRVYSAGGLVQSFQVPQDLEGNTWKVFQVIQGVVMPEQSTAR